MTSTSSRPRRVLILAEKPHAASRIVAAWRRHHPSDDIAVAYVPPVGLYRFALPRDLPISQVPRIAEPRYERAEHADGMTSVPEGCTLAEDLAEAASASDLVVCATDFDRAGVFNAWQCLDLAGMVDLDRVFWMRVVDLSDASLDGAVLAGGTLADPVFAGIARFGEAKRFFELNYAINALPCFSRILRDIGAPDDVNFVSKYALQILVHMAAEGTSASVRDLEGLMAMWPGSGKHGPAPMGSPISRGRIIEALLEAGLLEGQTGGEGRGAIEVSPLGHAFVSRLHKGVRDPDLAQRIEGWGAEWPRSRPGIERYVRTVFGKQRRAL